MIQQIHNQLDHQHVTHNPINLSLKVCIHTKSHHFQKAQLFTHQNMKDDLLASLGEKMIKRGKEIVGSTSIW